MPGTRLPLALSVAADSLEGRRHAAYLRRHVREARRLLDSALVELSIALVDDRQMAALHEQFSQVSGPTDVLTFELEHDLKNRVTSGEIIICVPFARRAAAAMGTALRDELLLYTIHGMLHLSGYDDRTRRGFVRMHQTEDRILTELGIGPVFAPVSPGSRVTTRRREGMGRR